MSHQGGRHHHHSNKNNHHHHFNNNNKHNNSNLRGGMYLAETFRIPDTAQCVHLAEFIYLKASATVHVSVQVPDSVHAPEEHLTRIVHQQFIDYIDPDQLVWLKAVKGAADFVRFEAEFATVRGMHLAVQQLDRWKMPLSEQLSPGPRHGRHRRQHLLVRAAPARHQFPSRHVWRQCCGAAAGVITILHAFYLRGVPKRWFPSGGCGGIMKRAFSHWGEVLGVDVTAAEQRSGTLNLRVRYQSHEGFQGALSALQEARICYWHTSEPWIAPISVDLGDRHAPDDGYRRWPDFLPAPPPRHMPPPGVETDPETVSLGGSDTSDHGRRRSVRDKSAERRRKKRARRRKRELSKKREKERGMERRIAVEEAELVDCQRRLESIRLLDVLLDRVMVERRKVLTELRLCEMQNCTAEEIAAQEEFEERRAQKETRLRDKVVSTYLVHEEKQQVLHKEMLLKAVKGKRQIRRDIASIESSMSETSVSSGSSSSSSSSSSSTSSSDSDRASSASSADSAAKYSKPPSDGVRSPSLMGTPPPPDPRMANVRQRGFRWRRPFQPRMRGRGFAPLLYDADGNDLAANGFSGAAPRRGQRGFRRGPLRGSVVSVRGGHYDAVPRYPGKRSGSEESGEVEWKRARQQRSSSPGLTPPLSRRPQRWGDQPWGEWDALGGGHLRRRHDGGDDDVPDVGSFVALDDGMSSPGSDHREFRKVRKRYRRHRNRSSSRSK